MGFAMSAVAVITPPTLDELIVAINREHQLVVEGVSAAVKHAIRCGENLIEARLQIGWGDWLPWLAANFDLSQPTAANYMQIARNKDLVHGAESIAAATRAVSVIGRGPQTAKRPRRGSWHAEARSMHAEGASQRQIAATFGVGKDTVARALDPEYRRRANERQAKSKRDLTQARKALVRERRDAAMKTAGGDAWDAYLLVRKLAPLLESLKLNSAYHKCASIEDDLVKAVKTST